MQEKFSSRHACFCKRHHIMKQGHSYFAFSYRLTTHELLQFLYIFIAVECQTMSFATISTCPTSFLIVTLYTLWYIVMYNKTHVWFIYSHSKCDGCHHDIDVIF